MSSLEKMISANPALGMELLANPNIPEQVKIHFFLFLFAPFLSHACTRT